MITNNDSGADDPKSNGEQRPALDARERDGLGARLRHEHGKIVREPLPLHMRLLLERLGRKAQSDDQP